MLLPTLFLSPKPQNASKTGEQKANSPFRLIEFECEKIHNGLNKDERSLL
jgi:hypothetical protein